MCDKKMTHVQLVKSKKTLDGTVFVLLLVISLVISVVYLWQRFSAETLYLAVAGPMTDDKGKDNPNGKAMQQGVQLAIDEINRNGGIHGKQVELLPPFDDRNNPELAKKIAQDVVKSKALAVIGHYTSDASLAAAEIYNKENSILAISGSATTNKLTLKNDWYFRVIFNDSDQGALLAYYVHKILGYDKASILFDGDAYGSGLKDSFIQTASMINLKIQNQWTFKQEKPNSFQNALEQVVKTLKEEKEKAGILFLATHSEQAAETIKALRQKGGYRVPIIGADALSSHAFSEKIREDEREKNQPGYYTDGIYMTTPFLFDLAGKRALDFKEAFKSKYPEPEKISTTAIMYYDAAQVILHALKKIPQEKTVTREQLKESLWEISNNNNAVAGVSGSIHFDKNGDVDKSIPIGIFHKGEPIAAWDQYRQKNWISGSQQTVENILSVVFEGKLIKANDKFRSKADVVYVGVEFNEISQLDTKKATYMVDFYLWFRFKSDSQFNADKHLDQIKCIKTVKTESYKFEGEVDKSKKLECEVDKIEFINIMTVKDGKLGKPTMIYKNSSPIIGDTLTKTYRVKAQFKSEFDFRHYPVDRQVLSIQLVHQEKTRDTLIYAVDTRGMPIDTLAEKVNKNHAFSVNGWQVDKISFYENVQETDSTFGNPDFFYLQHQHKHSRLNIEIKIKRHVASFFWKNLFPNMLLILLGYGIFFINSFGTQVALGVNLILPTSILHIRLTSELPTLAYFTLLEYTFYLIYFLAVFSLIMVIFMHIYDDENDNKTEANQKRVHILRLAGRIGYPVLVLAGILFIFTQSF